MNHLLFAADSLRVLSFKQVLLFLLLVIILNQTPPPICHLVQSICEALADLLARAGGNTIVDSPSISHLIIDLVRLFPNVVRHETFHTLDLRRQQDF